MFLNATMLAGLAGAMLPLVLHLLNRAGCRTVPWGAMMFLGIHDPRQVRRGRVKELALLLLRMGTVALLAVALARPVLGPVGSVNVDSAASLQNEPSCTVIILDRSASMGIEENGRPRFEAARRAVLGILANLRRTDQAAMVPSPEFPPLASQTTTDLQWLASRVSDLRWSSGRADLSVALSSASGILARSHAAIRQLLIVCDRQAVSWREVNDSWARDWRQSLRDASGRLPRVGVIPIGADTTGNVFIESVRPLDPPIVRGVPALLELRLRNSDVHAHADLPLSIYGGGWDLGRAMVSLGPSASESIYRSVTLPVTGSAVLTFRLGAPGLAGDDSLDWATDVVDPIGVLVISGDPHDADPAAAQPPSLRSLASFISLALAPNAAGGQDQPDLAKVSIVPWDEWPELNRFQYPVVVLADVPRLSASQARQIEQYVYGGGGLLIAPGKFARVEEYNIQLWRDGAGALPAQLDPSIATDSASAVLLAGTDLSPPILGFMDNPEHQALPLTVRRYFPLRALASGAAVLARYSNGQPFLVQGAYGRGRVLLSTASLGADWLALPYSMAYLPLVQSATKYLAASTWPDRNLWSGQSFVATIRDIAEPRAVLDGPGIGAARVELERVHDGYEARFSGATRPGRYTLRVTGSSPDDKQQISFLVRPPREEADLTSLTPRRWADLERSLGLQRVEPQTQSIAAFLAESRRRRELWPWLLGAVIGLGVLEMALTRIWTVVDTEAIHV